MPNLPVSHHPQMYDDLRWWLEHDRETGRHVVALIEETIAHPVAGNGKPKRLRDLPNAWSRRINRAHRLFYLLDGELRFVSCRGHEMPQHVYDALRMGDDV